jgi:hypothetical protein
MRRPRFNIDSLVLLVVVSAIGVAALRESSDIWDGGLLGLTLLILLVAVLLAIHRTDRRRAYWLGFTLWGGIYLAATFVPAVESRLPTTKALSYVDSKLPQQAAVGTVAFTNGPIKVTSFQAYNQVAFSPNGRIVAASQPGGFRLWNAGTGRLIFGSGRNTEDFVRIGHSLFALLIACLGAMLSRYLGDSSRGQAPESDGRGGGDPQSPNA